MHRAHAAAFMWQATCRSLHKAYTFDKFLALQRPELGGTAAVLWVDAGACHCNDVAVALGQSALRRPRACMPSNRVYTHTCVLMYVYVMRMMHMADALVVSTTAVTQRPPLLSLIHI